MKSLKKIPICIMAMFCFLILTGFRSEEDNKTYVFDDADVIMEEDEKALTEKCQKASEECKVTIAVATTYDAQGYGSRSYAERVIRVNDLGYEEDKFDKSVVLFLLDLDNSETYIVTSGLGILFVEDDNIEEILDQVYMYVHNDYYMACSAFVDKTVDVIQDNKRDYGSEYLKEWENWEGSYEGFYETYVREPEHNLFYRLKSPRLCLMIAVLIGGVSVAVMAIRNKSKMTANGHTYMDMNQSKMHLRTDAFIRTTTQKIRINSDSGSSGGGGGHGGSFHSGGGGHSYGGGGRKL